MYPDPPRADLPRPAVGHDAAALAPSCWASLAGRQPSVTAREGVETAAHVRRPAGTNSGCAWPPGSSRATLTRIVRAGEVPVTTGPQDPAAVGRDQLRASHADREQVIGTLKNAFVQGRADQGRARRASGPGARRAGPRRPSRAHRRHPARPGRSRAGAPARPGPPPAAGQGGRQVGYLPDHRGRRHSRRIRQRPLRSRRSSLACLPDSRGHACHADGTRHHGVRGVGLVGPEVLPQAAAAPAGAGQPRPRSRTARRHRPWPGSPGPPHRPDPR